MNKKVKNELLILVGIGLLAFLVTKRFRTLAPLNSPDFQKDSEPVPPLVPAKEPLPLTTPGSKVESEFDLNLH